MVNMLFFSPCNTKRRAVKIVLLMLNFQYIYLCIIVSDEFLDYILMRKLIILLRYISPECFVTFTCYNHKSQKKKGKKKVNRWINHFNIFFWISEHSVTECALNVNLKSMYIYIYTYSIYIYIYIYIYIQPQIRKSWDSMETQIKKESSDF